jgi:hypothetical protein
MDDGSPKVIRPEVEARFETTRLGKVSSPVTQVRAAAGVPD